MLNLSESYRSKLQILAGIIEEAGKVEITPGEIEAGDVNSQKLGWGGSEQRIMGYDEATMIDAIKNGKVIGVSYQSADMGVTKFRFILPVFLGLYGKKRTKKLRAYHISGQSEKAAGKTGKRSEEAYGEWRLFNVEPGSDGVRRFKGMWVVEPEKYFFQNPPNYNPNENSDSTASGGPKKRTTFITKIANFNAKQAYANYLAREPEGEPEVATLRPEPKVIPKVPEIPMQKNTDVTAPETGYDQSSLEEDREQNPKLIRNKLIRPLFKTQGKKKK